MAADARMDDAITILKRGRAKLAEPGIWVQGFEKSLGPGRCMWTALGPGVPAELLKPIGDYLMRGVGVGISAYGFSRLTNLFRWNDAPDRKLEDVLAAYDRAIQIAEAP